ncbi:hypothetical protein GCM10027084_27550 [Pseudoxanthomonas sangjuensis]|uniref:hypothetical protein n=1 Tax=Pseudoxanthomonas sangjuensis TaxID=1503750 RepID=UPI001390F5DA|nr:hypothetical protein [Pseudoxanthomonas sangjuensis]KAF1714566.1 hypothetical protein CSC71_04165 [Pseudoxanthomonas sangjuensis]
MIDAEPPPEAAIAEIRAVKQAHEARWLALPDVVAVGIGRTASGGNGIIVSVQQASGRLRMEIPDEIDGVAVEIRETGALRAD